VRDGAGEGLGVCGAADLFLGVFGLGGWLIGGGRDPARPVSLPPSFLCVAVDAQHNFGICFADVFLIIECLSSLAIFRLIELLFGEVVIFESTFMISFFIFIFLSVYQFFILFILLFFGLFFNWFLCVLLCPLTRLVLFDLLDLWLSCARNTLLLDFLALSFLLIGLTLTFLIHGDDRF
jgi:hypothetical protein